MNDDDDDNVDDEDDDDDDDDDDDLETQNGVDDDGGVAGVDDVSATPVSNLSTRRETFRGRGGATGGRWTDVAVAVVVFIVVQLAMTDDHGDHDMRIQ